MCVADSLIVLSLATLSLGQVRDDAPQTRTFVVQNAGTDTLQLGQAYTSCGCTTVEYTRGQRLAPADTAHIQLHFNPRGKQGPFEEEARLVYTADRRNVAVRLTGEVVSSEASLARQFPIVQGTLRLSADRFDLGRLRYGESRERTLVILHPDGARQTVPLTFTATPDLTRGLHHIPIICEGATVTLDVIIQ